MADQRIQATENMIGANHPTLTDTLNRLSMVEHNNDGTHNLVNATKVNKLTITPPTTGATLTLADGSTLATVGAFATTLTATGATGLTLPTTGTLATLSGTEALTNKTVNKVTLTAPASGSTLTILDGKTLTANNTITLAGTDSTVMTFPSVSDTIPGTSVANTFTTAQLIQPATDVAPLTLRGHASATAKLLQIQNSGSGELFSVKGDGHLVVEGVTTTGATGTGNLVLSAAPTFTGNVTINSTGTVQVPVGTDGQRPAGVQGMFRYNTTSGSFEGYNGSSWGSVGGGGLAVSTKTSGFSAVDKNLYVCNTSGGGFTCTLPSGVVNAYIEVWDFDGTWGTSGKELTITPNGTDKIGGVNTSLICNVNNTRLALTYCDTTQGWQIDIGGEAHAGAGFNPTVQQFSGDGSNPTFTLAANPGSALALIVAISGVSQVPNVDYTVSGTTLTFTTAPPSGTNNIMVHAFGAQGTIGTPADGSVVTASILDGAVTMAKTNFTLPAPVRQTVLTGSVDANGYSNFITPTAGVTLSVDIAATTTPLVIAFAYGFDANGAVDKIGRVTADTAIGSLTANRAAATPCFLYADRNTSTGAITYGHVILAPTYQYGGTPSVTANQHTYRIDEGKMYVGNGSSASVVQRVFLGEASTNASDVLAVVNYAYQGKYDSGWFSVTTGTTYAKNHNIGIRTNEIVINASASASGASSATCDMWYVVATGVFGCGYDTVTPLSLVVRTGDAGISKATTTSGATNITSGYLNVVASRGW